MFLSIIIPCYNEERRLQKNLQIKIDYLKKQKYDWEMILVNDGSTDDTRKIITDYIAKNKNLNIRLVDVKPNQGKGNAVKAGMLSARGSWQLFTDADNSTPMPEIEKLFVYKNEFDIIIASRYLAQSKIAQKQTLMRRFISRAGNLFIRFFLGLNFLDTQCGFKLFTAESAKKIFSKCLIKRWGFDLEILTLGKKLNFKIKEVAVTWSDTSDSKLRPVKAASQVFGEAIKIKYNILTNKYQI